MKFLFIAPLLIGSSLAVTAIHDANAATYDPQPLANALHILHAVLGANAASLSHANPRFQSIQLTQRKRKKPAIAKESKKGKFSDLHISNLPPDILNELILTHLSFKEASSLGINPDDALKYFSSGLNDALSYILSIKHLPLMNYKLKILLQNKNQVEERERMLLADELIIKFIWETQSRINDASEFEIRFRAWTEQQILTVEQKKGLDYLNDLKDIKLFFLRPNGLFRGFTFASRNRFWTTFLGAPYKKEFSHALPTPYITVFKKLIEMGNIGALQMLLEDRALSKWFVLDFSNKVFHKSVYKAISTNQWWSIRFLNIHPVYELRDLNAAFLNPLLEGVIKNNRFDWALIYVNHLNSSLKLFREFRGLKWKAVSRVASSPVSSHIFQLFLNIGNGIYRTDRFSLKLLVDLCVQGKGTFENLEILLSQEAWNDHSVHSLLSTINLGVLNNNVGLAKRVAQEFLRTDLTFSGLPSKFAPLDYAILVAQGKSNRDIGFYDTVHNILLEIKERSLQV